MAEGTIVKWLKNEGDPIAPGDALCDIQTDKAVMSFEVEEEGVLAKILVCFLLPCLFYNAVNFYCFCSLVLKDNKDEYIEI